MILLIGLLTMLAFVARAADPRGPEGLDVRKGTAVPLAEARP